MNDHAVTVLSSLSEPMELPSALLSPLGGSARAEFIGEGSGQGSGQGETGESVRLSYKFQRLREKLREAIASGELSGRLPGERQLARKFRVNAKTLSKALTDLAAEGLLDRSIGRGTFVRGTEMPASSTAEKWLVICDPDQTHWGSIAALKAANPEVFVSIGMPDQRPSFLNPFKAAIIFSQHLADAFVRDLVVRNVNVVIAGREPSTYSTHAVLLDRSHGAACLARELMLGGHRKFLAVETRGSSQITMAIRQAAARYAPDATVETVFPLDVATAMSHGATAVICDAFETAVAVRKILAGIGLMVPAQVSLAAVGFGFPHEKCSGYIASPDLESQSILELLRDTAPKRPATLWLATTPVDEGTIGPLPSSAGDAMLQYDAVTA